MNQATISTRADLTSRAAGALDAAASYATRSLNRHASEYDLSDAKLALLATLLECDNNCCCLHRLGDELDVSRPNVTKLVDGLEGAGMVERIPHPHDGRMVQARLTKKGADVTHRALPGRRERLAAYWSTLSDTELADLISLLERIARSDD